MFDKWYTLLTNASVGALTVDSTGQIYAVGSGLNSIPVTQNAFDPEYLSGYQGNVELTGFLLKLDSTGTHVLYGTYLNGLIPFQVTVDSAGFIYVLASHVEPDFDSVFSYPAQITPNAVQAYPGASITPTLLKIAPTGELVYETFLGGVQAGVGGALTVDQAGSAYVCGSTTDPTLALSGAYQTKLHRNYDVYIAKLNPQGTAYQAFTYLGGDGIDECAGLQLDQAGNVYVYGDTNSRFFPVTPGAFETTRGAGWSLFLSKLDPALHTLQWSTYVGGDYDTIARPTLDGYPISGAQSTAIAADGSIVFTAVTHAFDFPVSADTLPPPYPGSYESVVGVLDQSGVKLLLSYPLPVGSSAALVVTGDGNRFYVVGFGTIGQTGASATLNAEGLDGFYTEGSLFPFEFVAEIDVPNQSLAYFGPLRQTPNLNAIASGIAPDGSLVLSASASTDFISSGPPANVLNGNRTDGGALIFDFNNTGQATPTITAAVNPASLVISPFAPGQLVEVRGFGFTNAPATASDPSNPPTTLGDVQLLVDGVPAPLLSVKPDALVALLPNQFVSGTAEISVTVGPTRSASQTIATATVNPALFTTSRTGVGQAMALNSDGSSNSPQNPTLRGNTLRIFATGLGAVDVSTGKPNAIVTAALSGPTAQVANVSPAGSPYPSGYFAIDIAIPFTAPADDFVLITVLAAGVPSQSGITVAIR